MRLMIAIPALDYINIRFVECLTALIMRLQRDGIDYEVKFRSGTLVYIARDQLVLDAMNGGFTHVLWLDTDMVFPADLVDRLILTEKPFVSAVYHARRPPYESCIFKRLDPEDRSDALPDQVFEVEACGFGCVLIDVRIHRSVLLKCFTSFTPDTDAGEDIAFCRRVRKLGYHIWCDPAIRVGHIGHITVWPDSAPLLREAEAAVIGGKDDDDA